MSISLMKVLDQIGEIAKANGQNYYTVRAKITNNINDVIVVYEGYINPGISYSDSDPDTLVKKLRQHFVDEAKITLITEDIIIPEP